MVIPLSTVSRRRLTVLISLILTGIPQAAYPDNQDVEFNTDILDVNDKQNIDLSDFSRAGYIMPGTYDFFIRVNNSELPDSYPVSYIVPPDDPKGRLFIPGADSAGRTETGMGRAPALVE